MPFTVYVLKSETTGRLYIGQTNDLARRMVEHATGQVRSTRHRGPWCLLWREGFASRAQAVACERMLKALKSPTRVEAYFLER